MSCGAALAALGVLLLLVPTAAGRQGLIRPLAGVLAALLALVAASWLWETWRGR